MAGCGRFQSIEDARSSAEILLLALHFPTLSAVKRIWSSIAKTLDVDSSAYEAEQQFQANISILRF